MSQEEGVGEVNQIAEVQNAPEMIDLLRARRRLMTNVKIAQDVYLAAIVLLPIVSIFMAAYHPEKKVLVTLVSVIVALVEVLVVDRWRKANLKTNAKLQEEFDCRVLELPWNEFTAASRVAKEDVYKLAKNSLSEKREGQLRDWYPNSASSMPIDVARLACQRTNLWYDTQLRGVHAGVVLALGALLFLSLLVYGVAATYKVESFILVLLIPFAPAFLWVIREWQRHRDAFDAAKRLLSEMDKSIATFISKSDADVAIRRSRELQDAIYAHRAAAPLVHDLVYLFCRKDLEGQMQAGAQGFIRELSLMANGSSK